MVSPIERFAFIDSVHAAEFLQVDQDAVLDWIRQGRLRAFGGKPNNPFLRSLDVAALAQELGVGAGEPPRRTKSPSAKVQTRLTADARWGEVSASDIQEWVSRADATRRSAARKAVEVAQGRFTTLLQALEDLDEPS